MDEEITQNCPCCDKAVTMRPYDIGSGPEMCCPDCEWCWGANGQPLDPYDPMKAMSPEMRKELGFT